MLFISIHSSFYLCQPLFRISHASVNPKVELMPHATKNARPTFIGKTLPSPRKVMRKGDCFIRVPFPFPTGPPLCRRSLGSGCVTLTSWIQRPYFSRRIQSCIFSVLEDSKGGPAGVLRCPGFVR